VGYDWRGERPTRRKEEAGAQKADQTTAHTNYTRQEGGTLWGNKEGSGREEDIQAELSWSRGLVGPIADTKNEETAVAPISLAGRIPVWLWSKRSS
jgi:hypothetical protein